MNIFVLDRDPVLAAQYHCDKHVVKMVLETAQILSTVSNLGGYKPTHQRHPCVLWAGTSQQNFDWLVMLGRELSKEYTFRYDKVHKSSAVIEQCAAFDELPATGLTQFKQCMPIRCIVYKDPVAGYRRYYMTDKRHFCTWKRRDKPEWFI
jgi:hypothetical protein